MVNDTMRVKSAKSKCEEPHRTNGPVFSVSSQRRNRKGISIDGKRPKRHSNKLDRPCLN